MERYYVYVRPGYIEYFDDPQAAQDFAEAYEVRVQEVNIPQSIHTYGHQIGARAI